ncbi:cell division protein ZapA [Microvirga guangxiensis]|uniref:Cell division protein ZapA n=1 Tax=Microvirga guangxiensis TaxID=549386 RepID=A0A1G5KTI8_9HYPH|nr:cell division protein ZapA [Microvirga guangxiensis]SCZ03438.1 cell division protein ZapA [Microvirga guangxiensis]
MAQVTVTIAGQSYRIACAEGDEAHVERLAASYDAKINEMRGAFGDIGDLRLYVMAAMIQADELHEAKERLAVVEAELAQIRSGGSPGDERVRLIELQLAEGVHKAAERIEELARSLNGAPRADA